MGEVVLVCGPPAAGKTTWARRHAGPGDQVVDLDEICRSLGSRSRFEHPRHVQAFARSVRRTIEERAAAQPGRTFVIRSLPSAGERAAVAERLAARVVMLPVSSDEAISRAHDDDRPAWTEQAIRSWWKRYTPSPIDEPPSEE